MTMLSSSRTAEMVAVRRAAHRVLDSPLVFDDPFATAILAPRLAARLAADPQEFNRNRWSRYLRALLVARSRCAEDELAAAVARGVRQYVLLGAGLDTFSCRNPFSDVRVFEVDHPASQATKRARLAAAAITPPATVTFVPVDLAREPLDRALVAAGFDSSAPAVFAWLGVVPYLDREAIVQTLRYIGSLAIGTAVVFDYGVPLSPFNLIGRLGLWRLKRRVAAIGEPWKTFLKPSETRAILTDAGFTDVDDAGPAEINARYFADRSDGLRVGTGHIARARVAPTPALPR
jgi:methyltransferase (TIGR00027 family)